MSALKSWFASSVLWKIWCQWLIQSIVNNMRNSILALKEGGCVFNKIVILKFSFLFFLLTLWGKRWYICLGSIMYKNANGTRLVHWTSFINVCFTHVCKKNTFLHIIVSFLLGSASCRRAFLPIGQEN